MVGLTLEQLQNMGAKPKQGGGLTLEQLQKKQGLPTAENKSGIAEFMVNPEPIASPIRDVLKGAVKGIGSTLFGVGKLAGKASEKIGLGGMVPDVLKGEKPQILEPRGTAQKIGFGTEQAAEFLIPVGNTLKVATKGGMVLAEGAKILGAGEKATKLATTLGKVLTESAISGTEFAGKTALQTGGNIEDTKTAGIVGLAIPPTLKTAGSVINKIKNPLGESISSIIATMIGKSPEHIKIAFKNPIQVAEKMAQKKIPEEVRNEAVNALSKYRQDYGNSFEKGLEAIKDLYPFGKTGKILVGNEINEITQGLPSIFRRFRVAVTDNGSKLNFDKLNSAIVKSGERNNMERVFDTIKNQDNFSVQGVQDVAARINALSKFEEGGKTQSSAIISAIHDTYSKAIDKVYPELGKLRNQYKIDSEVYQGIDDVLKSVKKEISNPTAVTSAIKKLSNLFNEDNEAYLRAIQRLEQVSGIDLINSLVASEFKSIAPASFGSRAAQAGILSGAAITSNPLLLLVLPLFSPKLEGKLITGSGKVFPRISETIRKVSPLLPKAIMPSTRND